MNKEDINRTPAEVAKAGGKKVVGPISLPDKRQFAWFRDPDGHIIGLLSH